MLFRGLHPYRHGLRFVRHLLIEDELVTVEETKWRMLQRRILEKRIAEAFVFLRENGIEPILIKGWAAAQVYPNPLERAFGDVDLAVAPEDFSSAETLLANDRRGGLIDLHCGLRRHDTLSFADLYEHSRLVECSDVNIRILRPEDHLRVLCVHWLTDGGAYRERLWDIFYAVENRPADFDWERCLAAVGENRRQWIVCAIGLAHKYLDLNLKDTPIEAEAERVPEWVIRAVENEWQSGVRLMPLRSVLKDGRQFWRQIKKRMSPNPLQATVFAEGSFRGESRVYYQIKSWSQRFVNLIGKILKGG